VQLHVQRVDETLKKRGNNRLCLSTTDTGGEGGSIGKSKVRGGGGLRKGGSEGGRRGIRRGGVFGGRQRERRKIVRILRHCKTCRN